MICNRYLPQLVPYSSCAVTRVCGMAAASTCKIERHNERTGIVYTDERKLLKHSIVRPFALSL